MTRIARDLDLDETRQSVMEPVPKPHGDALQGRRFKPLNLVQQAMIERIAMKEGRSVTAFAFWTAS